MRILLLQLLPLVGVGIGILGTLLTTRLNERARWRREDRMRWDERRLDTYVGFAQSLKDVYRLAVGLIATRHRSSSEPRIEHLDHLAQLSAAARELSKVREIVLLLGDEATVSGARAWRTAVGQFELAALNGTAQTFDHAVAERLVDMRRDSYYIAARASLGVEGGDVEQAAWLSASAQ